MDTGELSPQYFSDFLTTAFYCVRVLGKRNVLGTSLGKGLCGLGHELLVIEALAHLMGKYFVHRLGGHFLYNAS